MFIVVRCGIYLLSMLYINRYNCNRYDEDEAKKARDAQEVWHVVIL